MCDDLDAMLRLVLLRLEEDVNGAMRDGPLQELWSARQLRSRQGDDAPVLAEQPHGRPSGMSDETEQLIRAAQNGDARAVQRAVAVRIGVVNLSREENRRKDRRALFVVH